MRSITAAILAHLAASPSLGCATEKTSSQSAPATVTATATATPTPTVTAVAPVVDIAVDAAPASIATQTNPHVGTRCMTPDECGPGLKCVLPFNGAQIIQGKPGSCRPINEPQMGGRPLSVGGIAHVALRAQNRGWLRDAVMTSDETLGSWRQELERAAFEEHASIAAFARTLCQLLALGAPAWLVQKTQRALADEVEHATLTFEWVERLGGGALGPGALAEAVSPFHVGPPEEQAALLACDVFRGGCVNETLAAHEVACSALLAPHDELRSFFVRIADDEARHAALAFETVAWLRSQFVSAACALEEERARFMAGAPERQRLLLRPLFDATFTRPTGPRPPSLT